MKFTIQTFTANYGESITWRLIRERKVGSLIETLKLWMEAMMDFQVDKIRIEVEKS